MNKSPDTKKQANAVTSDPRWASVTTKDKNADGDFYYSVRTTGVYCRPSCGARLPLPENVLAHDVDRPDLQLGVRVFSKLVKSRLHAEE